MAMSCILVMFSILLLKRVEIFGYDDDDDDEDGCDGGVKQQARRASFIPTWP
jgi:hypothetical protein